MVTDDIFTLDQPFHITEEQKQQIRLEMEEYVAMKEYAAYCQKDNQTVLKHAKRIKKGYRVEGLFCDGTMLHGLVYLPAIATWFHAWWDKNGKCQTPNCPNEQWALEI